SIKTLSDLLDQSLLFRCQVEHHLVIDLGWQVQILLVRSEYVRGSELLELLKVLVPDHRPILKSAHDSILRPETCQIFVADDVRVEKIELRELICQILGDWGAGHDSPLARHLSQLAQLL